MERRLAEVLMRAGCYHHAEQDVEWLRADLEAVMAQGAEAGLADTGAIDGDPTERTAREWALVRDVEAVLADA